MRTARLSLVVWNIYKQNREHWDSELSRFSRDAQLVLLQEASMTAALQRWIAEHNWAGTRVNAFQVLGESAGVLNLSRSMPQTGLWLHGNGAVAAFCRNPVSMRCTR